MQENGWKWWMDGMREWDGRVNSEEERKRRIY